MAFPDVSVWTERIRTHASSDVPKILIGNKIDVPGKHVRHRVLFPDLVHGYLIVWLRLCVLQIESSRGASVAKTFNMKFFETSAKNDTNVSKAFNALIKDIVQRMIAAGVAPGKAAGAGDASSFPAPDATPHDKKCVVQ